MPSEVRTIAIDSDGDIYALTFQECIEKLKSDCTFVTSFGSYQNDLRQFDKP